MTCQVSIVADSIRDGQRITTMQLRYWRSIHAEVLTHRRFSRNASSSRAIPIQKFVEQVETDLAMPSYWAANQSGMSPTQEVENKEAAENWWRECANLAARQARIGADLGLGKQVVNRVLEPYQYITVLVTSTEWDNFFALRTDPAAQQEIQELANAMKSALENSAPVERNFHLPYVTDEEIGFVDGDLDLYRFMDLAKLSAARCCRVSYNKLDGSPSSFAEDMQRFERLVDPSHPLHASPLEHQAVSDRNAQSRNFVGWTQFREMWENQHNPDTY